MAGEHRIRIDVGRDQALEFVSRLADDDEFRYRLQQDPKAVLWDYGVEISADLIPDTVELPRKEDVRQAVDQSQRGTMLQPSPESFFPVFACFFAFPFLTADR